MTDQQIIEKTLSLIASIEENSRLYYDEDDSQIEDNEYDALYRQLQELEKAYPHLIQANTPTNKVGGNPTLAVSKIIHKSPMLSLGNVFNDDELQAWFDITAERTGNDNVVYYVENKFDGLACSLVYHHGILVQGITRGDGRVGENITNNVKMVNNVPHYINELNDYPRVEIRGEVIMPIASFEAVNKQLQEDGDTLFSNPRNAAAGSLRQLDANITATRGLMFYPYAAMDGIPTDILTHDKTIHWLATIGFVTVKGFLVRTVDEVRKIYLDFINNRSGLDYEIDGIVLKVNDFRQQHQLGSTSREPRWAIAYKFPPVTVLSKLKTVTWQVGKTGQVTPVAKIEPVVIGGVTINSVTLHNVNEIERLNLMIGDTISVIRSGDVIPKITKVWTLQRNGNETPIVYPKVCPSCQTPLVTNSRGTALMCAGSVSCQAQLVSKLIHFASREAMDINNLSAGTIKYMVECDMLNSPVDFYRTKELNDSLMGSKGFGDKRIANILTSIEQSKSTSLNRFIYALSILEVGIVTANLLAENFGSLDKLMQATHDELNAIDGIGPTTANNIVTYFNNPNHQRMISELQQLGVHWPVYRTDVSLPLHNQVWCITGSLKNTNRNQAKNQLEQLGAKVHNSISKVVTHLLVGENAGSKLDKTKQYNIEIVDEVTFENIVNKQP